jgi:hypothetical protein
MKDIGSWLKSLIAALIGGAVASAAHVLATTPVTGKSIAAAAASGAATTLGAYLTQSPTAPPKN